jgi:phage terminase Nu1 subunit (DNA packaging protein)
MTPVTIAEFARMKGVTAPAVHKAIDTGRLKKCIVKGIGKKPKLDPVIAAQEWELNTHHAKRTMGADIRKPEIPEQESRIDGVQQSMGVPSVNQSNAVLTAYKARIAKIEYEERLGKLVPAADVKAEAFKIGRIVRDSMLNIPDRVSAEFAGITNAYEINMRLTEEITKALEALQHGEA